MPSIHQQMAKRAAAGEPKSSHKGRWIIIVFAVLLISGGAAAGVAYAMGWIGGVDPRVAEIREMQKALLKDGKPPDLTNPANVAASMQIMGKVRDLPPDLQKQVGQDFGRQFGKMREARMKEVLALPPDKIVEEIDKDLSRMNTMRNMFSMFRGGDKNAKPDGAAQGGAGQPGNQASNPPPSGPPANGVPQAGPGGPPWGGPPANAQQAQQRRNSFLSSVPPENRSAMTQYFQLLRMRANQTGQPFGR
jgi:hypothetical protein